MRTTIDFLDAVKVKKGISSDYALAPVLEVTRSQVSRYRNEHDFLSDEMCQKVASILEIDEGIVVAASHAERAKNDDLKRMWKGIYEKLTSMAVMMLLVTGLTAMQPAPAMASQVLKNSHDIYIMRNYGGLNPSHVYF